MSESASWPAAGAAHVYHADVTTLSEADARLDAWRDWLTRAEEQRLARFRHDVDRLLFLCGRGMAREIVGRALGMAPGEWPWREGPRGRPEIDLPDTTLRFNVAHSATLVVCGIARGVDIGVDVEDRQRRPVDRALVPRYCSPFEAVDIDAHGETGWHDRFLEYWTLKEAYLKARGLGIAVPLADLSFVLSGDRARITFLNALEGTDANWTFALFRPTARYVAAVATTGADAEIHEFV